MINLTTLTYSVITLIVIFIIVKAIQIIKNFKR